MLFLQKCLDVMLIVMILFTESLTLASLAGFLHWHFAFVSLIVTGILALVDIVILEIIHRI